MATNYGLNSFLKHQRDQSPSNNAPIPTYIVSKYTKDYVGPFNSMADAREWVANNDEFGGVSEYTSHMHSTQSISIRARAIPPKKFWEWVNERMLMKRARRHKRPTLISDNERKSAAVRLEDLRLV